jgi:hypothetical protein
VVHNLFAAQAWGDTRSGRPIAGTVESIEALTRGPDQPVLPPPLPPGQHGRSRSPATSTTPTSCAWCARRSARNGLPRRRRAARCRPAAAADRRRSARRVVEATRPFEQVNVVLGMPGRDPHRRAAVRPRRAQHRARRRHRRRLFQEVRERAAWPTRSTPSPATTPTPAWSASRSAACPPSSTRCWPSCREELRKVAADGITARSSTAARASCAAGLVLGLEDSGSRMTPDRQGRAGLRRAARHRRGDRPHRRRSPSTTSCARRDRRRGVRGGAARDPRRRRTMSLPLPRRLATRPAASPAPQPISRT